MSEATKLAEVVKPSVKPGAIPAEKLTLNDIDTLDLFDAAIKYAGSKSKISRYLHDAIDTPLNAVLEFQKYQMAIGAPYESAVQDAVRAANTARFFDRFGTYAIQQVKELYNAPANLRILI